MPQAINPEHPVYIISKGRWESRLTSRALEDMQVPYHIVIEPQEFDEYAAVIDPKKILVLPFSNLGQGSIPARNWVWEHSMSIGATRHWILDDNMRRFDRIHNNKKTKCVTGAIFRAAEAFVDRYENIALAGFQYTTFARVGCVYSVKKPFLLNARIYSCILIDNSIPYRWRGRYNEDTDLSLRALKDGWCTVLFYTFACEKQATMTMKGGNTDVLYQEDGRLKMAQSLKEQHPDVVEIKKRWGRWQHVVDYSKFRRNRLKRKPGVEIPKGVDNFGMVLRKKRKQEEGGFEDEETI